MKQPMFCWIFPTRNQGKNSFLIPRKFFYGTIVAENEFGFIVTFFNGLSGFLTFKDIEILHNSSRKEFQLGQTIKVYIAFVK